MSDDIRARLKAMGAKAEAEFRVRREEAALVRRDCEGKEAFSVEALDRELLRLGETSQGFSQRAIEEIEADYYLLHPGMKTLAELAEVIAINHPPRPWHPSDDVQFLAQRQQAMRVRSEGEKEAFTIAGLEAELRARGGSTQGWSQRQLEQLENDYYLFYERAWTMVDLARIVAG